jgi:hypothetical protein
MPHRLTAPVRTSHPPCATEYESERVTVRNFDGYEITRHGAAWSDSHSHKPTLIAVASGPGADIG